MDGASSVRIQYWRYPIVFAGRLGAYTARAAEQGFLAIGFCNSPIHGHFVSPWNSRERAKSRTANET
jgi:hypothetical protein